MGLTVIDAGVMIGFLDATDAHHGAARRSLAAASEQVEVVALPASAFAECLVAPARRGEDAVQAVRSFVDRFPINVVPLDDEMAEAAARLRARLGGRLRLPDALVVATAQVLEADTLVTTDRRWPRRRSLRFSGRLEHL